MVANLAEQARQAIAKLDDPARKQAEQEFDTLIRQGVVNTTDLGEFINDKQRELELRVFAAWLLGHISSSESRRFLRRALRADNTDLRCQVALSLGRLGGSTSIMSLVQVLNADPEPTVRACCAKALGWIVDEASEKALRATLDDPTQPEDVRGHAAEALSNFATQSSVEALINALRASEPEVRYWAAYSLGQLGADEALPELERIRDTDESSLATGESVRSEALDAIDKIRRHKQE